MNILVVGGGGREHAIAWALLRSPQVERVFCTPGNGGTATLTGCENVAIASDDFNAIAHFARDRDIAFVAVGPEAPLADGIADALAAADIPVFGPRRAAAQLEASKSWAKELMLAAGVPTPPARTFTDPDAAHAYLDDCGAPIVVKADGLAAGKGVTVAMTLERAHEAIDDLYHDGASDLRKVVIEDYLHGQEASVLALTDGLSVRTLLPAQDHKRIGERDTGPNTGGMGAYAPAPLISPELLQRIETEVLQPVVATLHDRGIDYCGVLYAGLTIAPDGTFKVLEFNCRFGDPETQAILPLLVTPLDALMLACIERRLGDMPPLQWRVGSALCVVAASRGYPGTYNTEHPIAGLPAAPASTTGNEIVFHAGTKLVGDRVLTAGGRVLGVTGLGADLEQAAAAAYGAIDAIDFEGIYYRRDIGHHTLATPDAGEGKGNALDSQ
ncbi:phosphoribosylamine-glycine ligase [Rubidibacter lacunae KORDI 51-2]|uniref:Phosphoribosylamine--glycine ligase n=1 Tax=Rubidibacter lacunae KORDI 51-2 TaxID=582515 RepID=U5DER9_9CHRO|nr:phosphoribosylamine--glycine ligase [Rubidibacter lacunae]ERN39792.1 phosphoribosylamine-glycine ligase [Rubidibacter lacunae KORDI 51-2]